MTTQTLPIAVLGAGPVGLAAAAHLLARGLEPIVLEAGERVGANALEWGHVRMFSPWKMNHDRASVALLEAEGWEAPPAEEFPTGRDLVERYLEPLAATQAIAPRVRLGARVTAVSRLGFDRMKTSGREQAAFLVRLEGATGEEELLASAVIDATGTWRSPNPLGASGLPALGEKALAGQVFYGIPDVLERHRQRYAGRRVLVVGSGHSAFNAVLDLYDLARQELGTELIWAVRRPSIERLFGGGERDQLAARGRLGGKLGELVRSGRIRVETGFHLDRLSRGARGVVAWDGDRALPEVDEIVATTGLRPDRGLLAELRLDLDEATEAPRALAPLIDPNDHSCGTVRPHGVDELSHPEPGLYVVGMKSYGRAPTFLLATGYEQVRSVAAALAGDWKAAREVQLVLPETGVCATGFGRPSELPAVESVGCGCG
ncbi:MAG TPA: NAD(P)-binding domain-containing protein [Thermoanaerobaculia bacterium]|nr:NAD(P)-binding domain-containing protein [Thermoanaerobaculia bacterium]